MSTNQVFYNLLRSSRTLHNFWPLQQSQRSNLVLSGFANYTFLGCIWNLRWVGNGSVKANNNTRQPRDSSEVPVASPHFPHRMQFFLLTLKPASLAEKDLWQTKITHIPNGILEAGKRQVPVGRTPFTSPGSRSHLNPQTLYLNTWLTHARGNPLLTALELKWFKTSEMKLDIMQPLQNNVLADGTYEMRAPTLGTSCISTWPRSCCATFHLHCPITDKLMQTSEGRREATCRTAWDSTPCSWQWPGTSHTPPPVRNASFLIKGELQLWTCCFSQSTNTLC